MKLDNTLDQVEVKDLPLLHSKVSIFVISVLISPLAGAILYSINLEKCGMTKKIFGTVTTIVICNYFAYQPFVGFDYYDHPALNLITSYISHIIMAVIMVFPFWDRHFKKVEHRTEFSWKVVVSIIAIFLSWIFAMEYLRSLRQHYVLPDFVDYLPQYHNQYSFIYLIPILLIRFFYILLKKKKAKETIS